MDFSSVMTIIVLLVLVLLSAYFSATETAFSSLNLIRVRSMAQEGNKRAALVIKLAENYDKLLSTILVGNNIVNLSAASIATVLFVSFFGNIGATVSTIVVTVVVLIFGEISPKSLAKESPESFAMFSASILQVIMVVLTPVNWLFTQWKKLLSRVFKTKGGPSMTEAELLTVVEEAEREGAINEEDRELIQSVIEFNDLTAQDILTPRVDIAGVEQDAPPEEAERCFLETGYSRIVVYAGTVDHIVGVLHLYDFFEAVRGGKKPLAEVMGPAVFVMPSVRISDLLKLLQAQKAHLAVVMDEYGGTVGIVTMEDILEQLVGEIWDEHDEVVLPFTRLSDGSIKVLCGAEVNKLFRYLGVSEREEMSTVSGWITKMLGKIPEVGDSFTYKNLTVTVQKVNRRRVGECLIQVADEEGNEAGGK